MKLIYHTSHCGSTLLTALLSTVNYNTYAEPPFLHEHIRNKTTDINLNSLNFPDMVVKMPSGLCHLAIQHSENKVFLYRSLGEHLIKIYFHYFRSQNYLNYYYDYMMQTKHPKLNDIVFDTDGKKHVFLWANRILWLNDSRNVLRIKTKDFLSNKKTIVDQICDHFSLPYVTDFSAVAFDVKEAGMNSTSEPLASIDLATRQYHPVSYGHGLIPEEFYQDENEIQQLINWIGHLVPELVDYI